MTTNQIKQLHEAQPFKPFTIHLADGSKLPVPHPEFMWVMPSGRTVFVALGDDEEDAAAIVDLLLVTKLTVSKGRRNGRKKP